MNEVVAQADFYAPDTKELALGICYVLAREGGMLTADRVAEVLGDFLQIPEEARNQRHARHPSHTKWTYFLAWASTTLRDHGFMLRNDADTRGTCRLTQHGLELGRWAERVYAGENPELPGWVAAFVQPLFTRMKSLLEGGKRRRPPDYEICRWVRYCYLLNQPRLGVSLFNLILADHVDAALFKQAERQARILKLRIEEKGDIQDNGLTVYSSAIDYDAFRRWMAETFPSGSRVQTLVRSSHNVIQEYTEEGVIVLSARSGREGLVAWDVLETAFTQLTMAGKVDHRELGGRGTFACAVLARYPGAQMVPGHSAVRLVAAGQASLSQGES